MITLIGRVAEGAEELGFHSTDISHYVLNTVSLITGSLI